MMGLVVNGTKRMGGMKVIWLPKMVGTRAARVTRGGFIRYYGPNATSGLTATLLDSPHGRNQNRNDAETKAGRNRRLDQAVRKATHYYWA
jgi:hypothetical protein